MNAWMNIQIRVGSAQALREMARVEGAVRRVDRASMGAAGAAGAFGRNLAGLQLARFGNQIQWTGRQLQYNWTLPILLAGGAATKFQLDIERAFVKVRKVYGDSTLAAETMNNELKALERNFEALSNRFGVHQKQVAEIGGEWAAAGVSGVALAKSVETTLRTMVLGEMEAAKATEALIAIQAQYGLNSTDLYYTIARLNQIENETGITLQGLVEGFARAAGVARNAGVTIRELGAMLAAITPAAGTAAQAGNALKTIISRLLVPTKEAAEVLGLMGINVRAVEWNSKTASERLLHMAGAFEKLDGAQKAVVSTVVASRFQINKFDALMRELSSTTGYYQKALDATADKAYVMKRATQELNAVLESNPKRLEIIWVMMQNALANVVQPLIPYIIYLANGIKNLLLSFQNLNPEVQKLILFGLLLLAAIGPLVRYIGSIGTLIGYFQVSAHLAGKALAFMLSPLVSLVTWLKGPLGTALGAATYGFKVFGTMLAAFPAFLVSAVKGVWFAVTTMTIAVKAIPAAFMAAFTAIRAQMIVFAAWMRATWVALQVGMTTAAAATSAAVSATWWLMTRSLMTATAAMGAIVPFFSTIGARLIAVARATAWGVVAAFTSPITLIVAAFIAYHAILFKVIHDNWDAITQWLYNNTRGVVEAVIKLWYALPEGIANAIMAVVRVVQAAAMQVYEWLSYLNPFARHSPSLVEQVVKGVGIIKSQFGSLASVGSVFQKIYSDIARFNAATAGFQQRMDAIRRAEERAKIAQFAPGSVGAYDSLQRNLTVLRGQLGTVGAAIKRQEAVVASWEAALDKVNRQLDIANDRLDVLRDRASAVENQLRQAEELFRTYAEAPIKGMGAMADKIFENEMAQKRLRLEIMKMEDATGPIEDVRRQLSLLAGDIEMATGEIARLRSGGAGSDILGPMEDHVAALRKQYNELQKTGDQSGINELQKQLEELQRAGERLDLEKALKFDPLQRQIDQLVNSTKELTFQQIITGIKAAKVQVAGYEAELERANAAVAKQELKVKQLEAARKSIQASYDAERDKLRQLEDLYRAIETAIRDAESAIRDMTGAADEMLRKMEEAARKAREAVGRKGAEKRWTPGAEAFMAAEGAGFPDVGGKGILGREGGIEDQSKMIDEFTEELARQSADMFKGFDLFGPIKRKWNEVWGWIKTNVGPVIGEVGNLVSAGAGVVGGAIGGWNLAGFFQRAWEKVRGVFSFIWDIIGKPIIEIGKSIWQFLKDLWQQVGPEIIKFKDLFRPLLAVIEELWNKTKPIWIALGAAVLLLGSIFMEVINHTIKPLLDALVRIIKGAIQIIRGIIEVFLGVFTGDWKLLKRGLESIWNGLWNVITGILRGAVGILVGIVRGFGEGIWNFLKAVWNRVKGDVDRFWSTIKTAFGAAVDWLKRNTIDKWAASLDRIVQKFRDVRARILEIVRRMKEGLKSLFGTIVDAIKGPLNSLFGWINRNLIKNINKITGVFGVPAIPEIPKFHKGGVIPGKGETPIMALGGEGVLSRRGMDAIGGKQTLDAINRGFASIGGRGGIGGMGGVGDFVTDAWSNITGQLGDWLQQGIGFALDQLLKPVPDMIKAILPSGWVEDMAVAWMRKLRAWAKSWGDKKDGGMGVGGTPGSGKGIWGLPLPKGSYRIGVGLYGYPGHTGQDLPAPYGTPVFAAMAGRVSRAARMTTSYGVHAFLDHAAGFQTRYAHLAQLLVRVGQTVAKGQKIGTVDSTGNSTGNHLHIELRRLGKVLNPRTIMGLDRGGWIPPGYSTVFNGTGDWERLVRSTDISSVVATALVSGVNMAARDIKRGWAGNVGALGGVGGLAYAGARARGAASAQSYMLPGGMANGGNRELHFHGDLSFPNITSGDDAKKFLDNLDSLARG